MLSAITTILEVLLRLSPGYIIFKDRLYNYRYVVYIHILKITNFTSITVILCFYSKDDVFYIDYYIPLFIIVLLFIIYDLLYNISVGSIREPIYSKL